MSLKEKITSMTGETDADRPDRLRSGFLNSPIDGREGKITWAVVFLAAVAVFALYNVASSVAYFF